MKLLMKIIAAIIIVLVALLFILPLLFKGEIIDLAKKEINNNVNATVDFTDMDLSLIKNFPNFSLSIDDLTVVGKDAFSEDTLAHIKAVYVVIDLFSVFGNNGYEVSKIHIDSPVVKVKVLKTGQSNYDIALPPEKTESTPTVDDEKGFQLSLKNFQISDAQISFEDKSSGMLVEVYGLSNSLSGNFTKDFTKLKNTTQLNDISVRMGNINYLTNASLSYKATIEADIKNDIYTLGKNELKLNDLKLGFNGSVALLEEGLNLVLTFDAPDNRFKSLLSLVPAIYAKDFESVEADGKLSVSGAIKGIYAEDKLPSFTFDVVVDQGMFTYPDLPKSVTDINAVTSIRNKGGDFDNTVINVSQFSLKLGENPFIASLLVKTPVSDPDIDAKIKGTLDLASLKDFYPVDNELSGTFITDLTLKGKLSSIEKERYDEFIAMGSLLVQNLNYQDSSFTAPVEISTAQLNVSPQYLDLVSFKMKSGESNLSASGKLRNYLGYTFKGGDLKGNLNMTSAYLNIDELIADGEEAVAPEPSSTTDQDKSQDSPKSSVIHIPGRIDFVLNTQIKELVYDKIAMKNVTGKVSMKDEVLNLDKLQMDVVKGLMIVTGSYSSADPVKPTVKLNFKLFGLDIPSAYNQFAVMRTYLPIAKKTSGKFSANFYLNSDLDDQMMPVYESMNGAGQLSTTAITVNDLNSLLQIAEALKFDKIKKLELEKLLVKFQFVDGKMAVKPFDVNYKNISATIEGWTSFDQSINYVMGLNIPREELGADANQMMENLLSEANKLGGSFTLPETIAFDVLIGGTLAKPVVKTALAQSGNDVIEKAKEEVIKEISKEAMEKAELILAEADKQAKRIIAEAEKQAKYLRENSDEAIASLNAETDKQAEALMVEAKKQGFVAELAASEAIKQLRKEADSQIQSLSNDSDQQAENLIQTAKKTAKQIQDEARKQADELLKP